MTTEELARLVARMDVARDALALAREREAAAMDAARELGVAACAAGMDEVQVAQRLGVSRHTVRRWLGKLPDTRGVARATRSV